MAATVVVLATFALAGFVKGLVGLGFPTITVAVLVTPLGLTPAIAVTIVPAIVTNVAQALVGEHLRTVVRVLWPFLALAFLGGLVGTSVLAGGDTPALRLLLGILLVSYALTALMAPPLPHPGRWQAVVGPTSGFLAGLVAGMVGSFTLPTVPYLQALGLSRDALIQALGVVFLTLSLTLALGLGGHGLFAGGWLELSIIAILPALAGMELGRRLRHRLPEARFRKVFLLAILVLGVHIAGRAVL